MRPTTESFPRWWSSRATPTTSSPPTAWPRETGTPITMRGGGTSIAGNSIGPGVVLDTSRHMNQILEIDVEAKTARVQPGVVLSVLQAELAPHGLRFGPDPSTSTRATLGGMIGNNACGAHAVAFGKTSDNVVAIDAIDGLGRRFTAGEGGLDAVPGLDELVKANMALIRTEFGRFGRQVSGYSLEHLLPENGAHLARFLVGSEGTLATVLEATLRLVDVPAFTLTGVFAYDDMPAAADAVVAMLAHKPQAVEGIDARLVDRVRGAKGDGAVPELPDGAGWLFVEVGGATEDEAEETMAALAADCGNGSVPGGARPQGGRRAVGHSRRRRGPRGPQRGQRGVLARLGGRRRASREPRHVFARV